MSDVEASSILHNFLQAMSSTLSATAWHLRKATVRSGKEWFSVLLRNVPANVAYVQVGMRAPLFSGMPQNVVNPCGNERFLAVSWQ